MFTVPYPSQLGTQQGAPLSGHAYGPGSSPTLQQLVHFVGGVRRLHWRFDLLTVNFVSDGQGGQVLLDIPYKGDITPYVNKAVLQYDSTQPVKRTLSLDMVETVASQTVTLEGNTITAAGIAYTTDVVQPVALLAVPGTSPPEWLHVPLGVFRFVQPAVVVPGYALVRHAEMPDLLSFVQENAATDVIQSDAPVPLTLPAGAYVLDVVTALLSNLTTLTPLNPAALTSIPGCGLFGLLPSNATVPGVGQAGLASPPDWPTTAQLDATIPAGNYQVDEGQSYLDLINHLLFTSSCYDLQCDQNGVLRIQPWPPGQDYTRLLAKDGMSLAGNAAQWVYDTTQDSIVSFGMTEDIALDQLYNVVEVIVEDGYRASCACTRRSTSCHRDERYGM